MANLLSAAGDAAMAVAAVVLFWTLAAVAGWLLSVCGVPREK